jgi:hypothetical protein
MPNPEAPSQGISRARKIATILAMVGASGLIAKHAFPGTEWDTLLFAAMTAAAGVGMTRRSVLVQVFSRAVTWLVFLPCVIGSLFALTVGQHLPFDIIGLTAATGASLALSWPMLHTVDARKAFGPNAFRHWFLAGATTTAATGIVAGGIAFEAATKLAGNVGTFASFGALSLALLASAIGVVRMRGWGILLGALTSVVLLAIAPFLDSPGGFALMLAAAPSLLLQVLPVLVARVSSVASSSVRVDDTVSEAFAPTPAYAGVRIATDSDSVEDLDESRRSRRNGDVGAEPQDISDLDVNASDGGARRASMRA